MTAKADDENLSTYAAPVSALRVDNSLDQDSEPGRWLGFVVPKRHARRAVTRSLLKRQIRGAFERHAALLPAGLWLVRLRLPFATAEFVSARSARLAAAAREELDRLFARAAGDTFRPRASSWSVSS